MRLTGFSLVRRDEGDLPQLHYEDPPWDVTVGLNELDGTYVLTLLQVTLRTDSPDALDGVITAQRLRRLPVRQLVDVAASALKFDFDEVAARSLVQPKPPGARSWDRDHYERVLRVYEWARRAKRKGGGRGAVAEFWEVSIPTVEAWLRIARQQQAEQPKAAPREGTAPNGEDDRG